MSVAIRQACESDLADLLELMREFYGPAQAIYRGVGFASTDRELLTLALADPTHIT